MANLASQFIYEVPSLICRYNANFSVTYLLNDPYKLAINKTIKLCNAIIQVPSNHAHPTLQNASQLCSFNRIVNDHLDVILYFLIRINLTQTSSNFFI